MTENITALHAHVDTYAVDCDGPISRSYIITADPERDQRDSWDGDGEISFRERVLGHVASAYTTWQGTLTVTGDEMGGLTKRLEWSEQTEEGGRHVTAVFCDDDCETNATSYRDHRAEEMGY